MAAREIGQNKFDDWTDYVRERVHRERMLNPLSAAKMNVSGIDLGENFLAAHASWVGASACGGHPYVEPTAFGGYSVASGCGESWGQHSGGWIWMPLRKTEKATAPGNHWIATAARGQDICRGCAQVL